MQSTLQQTAIRTTPLLLAALLVGIAGDLLIPPDLWRAGFALWMVGVTFIALGLRTRTATPDRERTALIVGAAIAATGLAWRDAEMLLPIDLLSTLCMGALVAWHATGRRIADLTMVQAVRAAVIAVVTLVTGAPAA